MLDIWKDYFYIKRVAVDGEIFWDGRNFLAKPVQKHTSEALLLFES